MDRKFEAIWKGTYVTPATEIVDIDFFSGDKGYDVKEIKRIESLAISQSLSFDQGDHVVTRIE